MIKFYVVLAILLLLGLIGLGIYMGVSKSSGGSADDKANVTQSLQKANEKNYNNLKAKIVKAGLSLPTGLDDIYSHLQGITPCVSSKLLQKYSYNDINKYMNDSSSQEGKQFQQEANAAFIDCGGGPDLVTLIVMSNCEYSTSNPPPADMLKCLKDNMPQIKNLQDFTLAMIQITVKCQDKCVMSEKKNLNLKEGDRIETAMSISEGTPSNWSWATYTTKPVSGQVSCLTPYGYFQDEHQMIWCVSPNDKSDTGYDLTFMNQFLPEDTNIFPPVKYQNFMKGMRDPTKRFQQYVSGFTNNTQLVINVPF